VGSAITRNAGAALLVLLMAVGSVVMWVGAPLFWLWLASQLADSSQPSLGMYLLVLVGIIVSMAVIGKLLGWLNRTHQVLTGRLPRRREQTVWLKSMRAERDAQREHGVLGLVMAWSVSVALTLFGIWFFFFAEGGGI
jgi:hypothetical protein